MAPTLWDRFGHDWPVRLRRRVDLETEDMEMHVLRVEELHEDDTLVVRADLPGVDPDDDVRVEVADGVLHIEAHREESEKHKGSGGYRSEFRYGAFVRDMRLPTGVDTGSIQASYHDGILEVRVPWPEAAKVPVTKVSISRS